MRDHEESEEMAPPLLVRIAGLPTSVLKSFKSDLCHFAFKNQRALNDDLTKARSEMVERLHGEIGGSSPELRRFLLTVKRDCFNGRSLGRHRDTPPWEVLQQRTGHLGDRIVQLEEQLAAAEAAFETAYRGTLDRERLHLAEIVEDRALLRGIALASRVLADNLVRLGRDPIAGRRDRKVKRLEVSLLRYVSRTAVKLSPYSTLTRLGLGTVREDLEEGGIHLRGSGWQQRSLLRLKRYALDQYWEVLRRYLPFRESLRLALNTTSEEIAPDRYRFLRPGHWDVDEERGRFRFVKEALVKVTLANRLIPWLRAELAARPVIYRDLLATIENGFPDRGPAGENERYIEDLLRIGFLQLLPPWPTHEGHLERRMLEHLRSLADDRLQPFIERLEGIVVLESGYPDAQDPVRSVEEIDRLIDEAWKALAPLGGIGAEVGRGQILRSNFYEDVFLVPAEPRQSDREILRVSRAAVDEVLHNVEPLVGLKAMNNHRHDFLHTLAASMKQRWPDRSEVGLLELFSEVQPLWTEYLKYDVASRRDQGWKYPFNPLNLPHVDGLHKLRETIWLGLRSCAKLEEDGSRVFREDLVSLLEQVPERYRPSVSACLFLQPANPAGTSWVLNRIYEGVGRFGSRFTPSMEEEMRRRYTGQFTKNSVFEWKGQRVELLDVFCTQGDTLNVHFVQTPRILEIPGESSELPQARKLALGDLYASVDEETQLPRIVDAAGRHLLPVHLGGASHIYMPSLVKFLCVLGPGEGNPALPAPHTYVKDGMKIRNRLSLGNVVLRRKRWVFPPAGLAARIADASETQAFTAVNRWRTEQSIPERVFMIERVPHELLGSRYKPQYLDFTSPLFVSMFRAALKSGDDLLVLEEMLPDLDSSPRDESGERWALELLLDTLALPRQDWTASSPSYLESEQRSAAVLTVGEEFC